MKMSQIYTENYKDPRNFSIFEDFFAFFSKFLTDFVDWNVEKGQQGKNVFSTSLSWRDYCSFLDDIASN